MVCLLFLQLSVTDTLLGGKYLLGGVLLSFCCRMHLGSSLIQHLERLRHAATPFAISTGPEQSGKECRPQTINGGAVLHCPALGINCLGMQTLGDFLLLHRGYKGLLCCC